MNNIKLINDDCMNVMKNYENNYFDLAIVDPPYGINADRKRGDTGKNSHIKQKNYHFGNWDSERPKEEYFKELKRVSKNQIIWGGNYFLNYLNSTSCFIVWDKKNGENLYADCELAWCSFSSAVRKFEWKWHGFLQQNMKDKQIRIHPTEKPIKLYEWLLKNYSKKEDRILDTHLGSGSSAIASYYFGVKEFVGIELDKEYFETMKKRFKQHTKQIKLF
tara:strand:- start:2 stop:658 length:657 start_codon:yes stop_codon:yes gene_type:complete